MLELKSFAPDVLYAFLYVNDRPGTYPYHAHAFLEMSIMLAGSSDYQIEGHWHHIKAGQVLLFNPGVHHQETQKLDTTSTQLHIGFRHIALPGMAVDTLPFADSVVSLGEQASIFFTEAQQLANECRQTAAFGHQLMVQAQVVRLLCWLMRALPDNRISADHVLAGSTATATAEQQAVVVAAQYFIQAHYQEADLTLGSVAEAVHVSPAHLSRLFKQLVGESPMSFLTKQRMAQAQQLLHEKKLPVKLVAQSVGYADPYYFSRLFKQHFGVPPSLMV